MVAGFIVEAHSEFNLSERQNRRGAAFPAHSEGLLHTIAEEKSVGLLIVAPLPVLILLLLMLVLLRLVVVAGMRPLVVIVLVSAAGMAGIMMVDMARMRNAGGGVVVRAFHS